jgi:hypothetical protein
MLQFAHIALERLLCKVLNQGRIDASDARIDMAVPSGKFQNQRSQIMRVLAQRRQVELHDIQTMIEIGAEAVLLYQRQQRAVTGGENPHIHMHLPIGSNSTNYAALQNIQQLG